MAISDDRRAMDLDLGNSPWQMLPEMVADYRAERAGIEAGLLVLEAFHHVSAAQLVKLGFRQAGHMRLGAAVAVAKLRADIVGAMR
ncbi:hypothetical protein J7443_17490 [Tropicibacter sp. R15_0]|uniref:hypothetical protein n=1 Tax=Tropicibacter sp. R15_0 TaxID=2821101 RepID=UPI001ADD531F|nr:hypothetical protein [Tropicibacter sp. R15_0]MBO9467041.1 hypothetical protein [Tropicibacter sp. R15_0]